jgi:translation elongation factor EF-1beta
MMNCAEVNLDNIVEYVKKNIKYLKCVDINEITEDIMFELFSVNLNVYSFLKPIITPKQLEKLIEKYPFLIEQIYMPNIDLIKKAVKSDPNVLSVVFNNKLIKITDDNIYNLVKNDVSLLKFVPKKYQTENLIKKLCEIDIEAYKYTNLYIEEIEEKIVNEYPEHYKLIKIMKTEYYPKLVYVNQSFFFNIIDNNLINEIDYKKLFERFPNLLKYIYDKIDRKYWVYAIIKDISLLEKVPYDESIIKEVIKYNGYAIKYLKVKTTNDIINAINNNVLALDYVQNKRKSFIDYAYKLNSIAIKYKNVYEMKKEELLDAVKRNYEAIKYIPNDLQTSDMQIIAIEGSKGNIISYLKPIDNSVIKYLLGYIPSYILSVENPTDDMYLIAFSKQPSLILQYDDFENKFSVDILKAVLFSDPSLIQYYKNPTKEMMLIAVENNPETLKYLDYQDYDILYTALSKDPSVIKYADKDKLTDDLIEMVYKLSNGKYKLSYN